MTEITHHDPLHQAFTALLQDLSLNWPKQDIAYVREEIDHREYGDALENLIALGLENGQGFGPAHIHRIEMLAATMGLQATPLIVKLRTANGHAAA